MSDPAIPLPPADAAANQHTDVAMEHLLAGGATVAALAALSRGAIGLFDRSRRGPLLKARRPRRSIIELPYKSAAPTSFLPSSTEDGGLEGILAGLQSRGGGGGGSQPSLGNRPSVLAPPRPQAPNPYGLPQHLAEKAHAWGMGGGSDAWRASPAGQAAAGSHYGMGQAPTAPAVRRPGESYMPGEYRAMHPTGGMDSAPGRPGLFSQKGQAPRFAASPTPEMLAKAKAGPLQARPGPAAPMPGSPPSLGTQAGLRAPVAPTSVTGYGNRAARARFQARGGAGGSSTNVAGNMRAPTGVKGPLGPTPGSMKPSPVKMSTAECSGASCGPPAAASQSATASPSSGSSLLKSMGMSPLAQSVPIKGTTTPMPSGRATPKLAGDTMFTPAAKWLSENLGLHRDGGPAPFLDQINPKDSTSGWTMPWMWGAASPVAAGAAYAGWKPTDSAFNALRKGDDEDELGDARSRYEDLLRRQALAKAGSAGDDLGLSTLVDGLEKSANPFGEAGDIWKGTLAATLAASLMGGGYLGYNQARAGSSDKVMAEALRQRRQAQLAQAPHPFYLKPTPFEEDEEEEPTAADAGPSPEDRP